MKAYIPGIYCYCDLWCERCPFSDRCAVFAGSQDLAEADPEDPAFWQKLMVRFAESHGYSPGMEDWEIEVRPSSAEEQEEAMRQEAAESLRLQTHPLLQRALGMQQQVMALLEDTAYWRALARKAAECAALGLRSAQEAMDEAGFVTDCLTRLRRYTDIVLDRLCAALDPDDSCGNAPDGLAKVALLSVAAARTALTELYGIFADEDRMLPLFGGLGALERATEAAFPNARAFVRPGFDGPCLAQIPVANP